MKRVLCDAYVTQFDLLLLYKVLVGGRPNSDSFAASTDVLEVPIGAHSRISELDISAQAELLQLILLPLTGALDLFTTCQ